MRLVFCGTPQFAVPTLEKLIEHGFDLPLIVTNPDEPRGRGYVLKPPPVKEAAARTGIEVYQPAKLRTDEAVSRITAARPDAVVVVAYGHIIPQWMIGLPPLGCVNLHASLLPRYRGAAPVAWAIIRGESVTGNTTMKIDAGLDTGDILLQEEMPIAPDDTAETLGRRLSVAGARLMVETLNRLQDGSVIARPQDHALATLAPLLKKQDGLIDWTLPAVEIARRVRGLQPWPVAHTTFRQTGLRLWQVHPVDNAPALAPGELKTDAAVLFAGCGNATTLELAEMQLDGRKRLSGRDFANGVRLAPGERMGL